MKEKFAGSSGSSGVTLFWVDSAGGLSTIGGTLLRPNQNELLDGCVLSEEEAWLGAAISMRD